MSMSDVLHTHTLPSTTILHTIPSSLSLYPLPPLPTTILPLFPSHSVPHSLTPLPPPSPRRSSGLSTLPRAHLHAARDIPVVEVGKRQGEIDNTWAEVGGGKVKRQGGIGETWTEVGGGKTKRQGGIGET